MADRPEIPRSVKPRRPARDPLPLLIVTPDSILDDETGELLPREQLPELLLVRDSAIIVCGNAESLLADLHRRFKDHPLWQFRLTPITRERWNPEPGAPIETQEDLIISFFGFKRPHGRSRSRYFYPLAPEQFARKNVRELVGDPDLPYPEALRQWGRSVRSFCADLELNPSPTQGGIAAQLLRHPRFYPEARRKVPQATNERARPRLPGNWYELRAEPGRTYSAAWYLDQKSAHHYAAATIDLPHPDRLRAHGHYEEPESCRPWLRAGSRGMAAVLSTFGLVRARLTVPSHVAHAPFPPPALSRPGDVDAWLYTNEIPGIIERGARIDWLSAAWTSTIPDPGIRRYATWSQGEIARRPEARWLKGTLLASYGILAARPRRHHFAYWQATSGERERIRIAADMVECWSKRTEREQQTPIANVIQRGMIEAETRRLSIDLAGQLERAGHEVFAIYADAVLVRARDGASPAQALPLLPEPWRIKEDLSWIRFHDPQSFEARELSRLPGRPRGTM